jgi:hypothetical protein
MTDNKDAFIAAHEELIAEALEADPTLTEGEAYDQTADAAYVRMTDKFADHADYLRKRAKEEGL